VSSQVKNKVKRNAGHTREGEAVRIESVVSAHELPGLKERLKSIHPAENLKYEMFPLLQPETSQGIGRCGDLPNQTDLKSLVVMVKRIFGLKTVRMVGEPDLAIQKAAVCTGSGGSLVSNFLASQAEVFISGDIKYHEAREVQAAQKSVIDIGHFASEHIMVSELTAQLQSAIASKNLEVTVSPCPLERDPFIFI
jgi:putative NIF3 family GTP cyclohydrolase 1 type 2